MEESKGKKIILIVDRHGYVLESVMKLLEKSGYKVFGFLEGQEDILKKIKTTIFDVILIRGGIDPHLGDDIRKILVEKKPDAIVVEHSGGPATLISVVDSALQDT